MKPEIYIERYLNDLILKPGKALVIYGPRQAGKTTLVKHFLQNTTFKYRYDSGDNILLQAELSNADFKTIQAYMEGYELIVIDEAQNIPNIGQVLKIIVDQFPEINIIATGSSSFELAGQVGEPLTGRKRTITLYPIAQLELAKKYSGYDLNNQLEDFLIYGSYPEVIASHSQIEKREAIREIASFYALKDIFTLDKIKNSKPLVDLLRLLAFQVGNEVSLPELASAVMIDAKTVGRYLDLLEKSFVIYQLRGFSRNLRKEITKKSKYYFYDVGVRNAIIANFNPLHKRDDVGRLWENFLILERIKKQSYQNTPVHYYFWRTWDQKEIDFIEDREGQLFGYEFKWAPKALSAPKEWLEAYPQAKFEVIHPENYLTFLTS